VSTPAEVTPTRFDPRGEAVAGPVRVFGGIPGEAAEVRVVGAGQHTAHAVWTSARTPAPGRVDPPCPHWLACGGCPWMHMDGDTQRMYRRQLVADALEAAGVSADVSPVVPCPDGDTGFRHLVKLVPGGRVLGVYGRHSHDVVPIDGCVVAAPELRRYTTMRHPPAFRHLVLRRSRHTGATLATVVATAEDPALVAWATSLPADGVHLHLHRGVGDAIFDPAGPIRHIRGCVSVEERAGDAVVEVGPADFFQTNPSTAQRIWASLPRPTGPLVDLYCGIGAVGLALGATRIWGVEENERSVVRARANAARNRVDATYVSACVADADVPLRDVMVVVNPPRKGLEPGAVARVVSLRPSPLVYVSCHPAALARDLSRFVAAGLRIVAVQPFDMFPNTSHVETVAVLA
jgi:23S rRNA (uracil1939-C5)-methyltransferase